MCLRKAKTGGLSCVANVVAIYNELVKTRPDLVAALYEPLPYDARQEQAKGQKPYYLMPIFTEHKDRLFVRFIPQYVLASQKHADAPRLSPTAHEALKTVTEMARDPRYNVYMDLAPGEMQFINNYHVLHGRQEYQDDVANGYKRHLKRLWLSTRYLKERPDHFRRQRAFALGQEHLGQQDQGGREAELTTVMAVTWPPAVRRGTIEHASVSPVAAAMNLRKR